MWHKFKAWWQRQWKKIKEWCKKNKAWLIALFTAFGSGIAVAFSLTSKRNARVLEHITRLEQRLADYEGLNQRLAELNTELETRLEFLDDSNSELRIQNKQLRDLADYAREDIAGTRADLERAKSAIGRSEITADEIATIGDRLQSQSTAIDEHIARLAEFIEKYGEESSSL